MNLKQHISVCGEASFDTDLRFVCKPRDFDRMFVVGKETGLKSPSALKR